MAELEPRFGIDVTVALDGDDDAAKSTANVLTLLEGALAQMVDWGAIRKFTVEVRPCLTDANCLICGHEHSDNDCPPYCAGCGRPLDQVVAGLDAGCPVCTRFCEVGL